MDSLTVGQVIRLHHTGDYTGYVVEGVNFGRALTIEENTGGCLLLYKRIGGGGSSSRQYYPKPFLLLAEILDTFKNGYECRIVAVKEAEGQTQVKAMKQELLAMVSEVV